MSQIIEQPNPKRKQLQTKLQKEFNNKKTYQEKLITIYYTLLTSQKYYLKYKNNEILNDNNLNNLIEKLNKIENINDFKFFLFVQNNIIAPLNSKHINLSFENEYINKFLKYYNILKNQEQNNQHIANFLNSNQLENLLTELSLIEEIDNPKFITFLEKNILTVISKEKLQEITKETEENCNIVFEKDTIIITLHSFSKKHLKMDQEKFKKLSLDLKKDNYQNIIIDIRKNGGGTDEYFNLFNIFSNKKIIHNMQWFNLFQEEYEQNQWTAIEQGTNEQYNIFLLIDDKVFSSADSFARLCQHSKFATIIGEPTLGEGYGSNPLTISLKTKNPLILTFPIDAPINKYGNIDYENYYNTKPHIFCNSNQAMNTAKTIIEQNNKTK